jgi:hypothetical protein
MNTREAFCKDGYFLARGLLPVSQVEQVYEDVKKVFSLRIDCTKFDESLFEFFKTNNEEYKATAMICQFLPSVYRLGMSNPVLDTLQAIGHKLSVINTRPLMSFSSSRLAVNDMYWKVPAHQDWHSMQGSLDALTVWTPLVNVPPELGPLEVVPGSHLQGVLDSDDNTTLLKREHDFISLPMNKGDVLFMSTFLIHRSGHNRSDHIRLSTHFRYDNATESTFISRNFPHHFIDKRKEGMLYPNFPTSEDLTNVFKA